MSPRNAVIIATGESLTQEQCEIVRVARTSGVVDAVIAVNNAGIDRAPWADALVAGDSAWWAAYAEEADFKGKKIARHEDRRYGVEMFDRKEPSINSGLLAMYVARDTYASINIALLGFDLKGSHYHGKHAKKGLTNPKDQQFKLWERGFKMFSGANVINCSPRTALNVFKKELIGEVIVKWRAARGL